MVSLHTRSTASWSTSFNCEVQFACLLFKGAVSNATSRQQKILNCENVIDALSHDVLNVDLSHITAENIVDGDIATIQNLLEIFKELLDFIIDVDDEFDVQDSGKFNE